VSGRLRLALALVLGLALLPRPSAGGDGPQIGVELAPDPVGMNELATLTIEVSTSGFGLVSVQPRFRLENLELVSGPSTTQSQRWVNGQTSASTTLSWSLRPLKAGRAAVRDIVLTVGGRALTEPDHTIEIVAAAPPRPRAPSGGPQDPFAEMFGDDNPFALFRRPAGPMATPKLHLEATLDRAVAYPGEQVDWRLELDTQTEISAFEARDLPDFHGFWARDVALPEKPVPRQVTVGNERVWRVTMLQRALYPLQPGRYSLGPATADVVARVAAVGWFGPLGGNQQVTLHAQPVVLEVRPLPPPPPDFSGVVGDLHLEAALDRRRLEVGQAATLTVAASGPGNLEGLTPPALALPAGLRLFGPRPQSSSTLAGGRLASTVTWTYVVTAERPGSYAIPAVRMVWFDPATASYRTATTRETNLDVAAPAAIAAAAPAAPPLPPAAAGQGRLAGPRARIAAALALGAALLAATLLAARTARTRAPQRERRRRLASRLDAARAEPSPRLAAAALEEAWRAYVGERWGLGPALPVARWREALARAGVPAPRASALVALLDELHYLRFAPELSDVESLRQEALESSRRLLRDLA
jgi:hypothetical protein